MEKIDRLKMMIADSLGVERNDINSEFSLRAGKFKTSAGSVILGNMIRKVYGQKVDTRRVTTFGDLIALVEGGEVATETAGASPEITEIEDQTIETESPADERGNTHNTETDVPHGSALVCGIDIQEISIFPEAADYWSESFYSDNYTDEEIAYCSTADSPRHSFAARWCLKEALHKCGKEYYDIPLKDIQIKANVEGILSIEIREEKSWRTLPFACSLSHADNYAVGIITGVK